MSLPEPQNLPKKNTGIGCKPESYWTAKYTSQNTTFSIKDIEKMVKEHVDSEVFLHQIHEELTYALLYGHSKNRHCKREFYNLEDELEDEDYIDLPWKDGDYRIDRYWLKPKPVKAIGYFSEDASPSEMLTVTEYRLKEIEDLGDMWIARYYR